MLIREAEKGDLAALLALYTHLNDEPQPPADARAENVLAALLRDEKLHLLVCEIDGAVAAAVTLSVLPSLTHGLRPYGVVEHVVTHGDYRRLGCAAALLARAEELARAAGCYKLMLITGRREDGVHRLYRAAGYAPEGKTAYVKPL